MKRVRATAVVTVTLTIPAAGVWGADCAIEQVHRQALRETLQGLQSPHSRLTMLLEMGAATLSNPKVQTILVEEDA